MKIKFRYIPGFGKFYKIGTNGEVKSKRFKGWSLGNSVGNWRVLKGYINKKGYVVVALTKGDKKKPFFVHQLVLETFVGPCPKGKEVRHYPDRTKNNNNLNNLSYASKSRNQRDRLIHGTDLRGDKSPLAKLCKDQRRLVIYLHKNKGYTQSKIGRLFDVWQTTIGRIIKKGW